jgi:predicted small secreted protein
MKKMLAILLLAAFSVCLLGCGETVHGIGKDASRIGKGVKTIFIREQGK